MITSLVLSFAMLATPVASEITTKYPQLGSQKPISINKPHKGGYFDQIEEASEIPKKWRNFTECILDRESGATIERIQSGVGAKNPRSSASGKFQFLDSSWRDGLAHNVRERLVEHGVPQSEAKRVRIELSKKPIYRWHGYWQHVGYVEVIKEPGGWRHWRNNDRCDSKRAG
jgi:hypothetical protein